MRGQRILLSPDIAWEEKQGGLNEYQQNVSKCQNIGHYQSIEIQTAAVENKMGEKLTVQ